MIWFIQLEGEGNFISSYKEQFIIESLGRDNVKVVSVKEDDDLSFLVKSDIVVCQTRSLSLIRKIESIGCRNTCESSETIELTYDKEKVKNVLEMSGILFPRTMDASSVDEQHHAFVKPLFGADSDGVDEHSLVTSEALCIAKCQELKVKGYRPIIEEFIEGTEATVAVLKMPNGDICAYPIEIELGNNHSIMTKSKKMSWTELCSISANKMLVQSAKETFKAIGCKHYMRIDFRIDKKGYPYVIDLNLYPGLGPIDHFAKCLYLNKNITHHDILNEIINTSTIKRNGKDQC